MNYECKRPILEVLQMLYSFNPIKVCFNDTELYNDYNSNIEIEPGVTGEIFPYIQAIEDRLKDTLDKYENIYYNKAKTFVILKKVITTILEKMKVVFIVDSFEYIDGMSYDFLKELLEDDFVLERSKFVFITSNQKPGMGIITSQKLSIENYLDLTIAPFTPNQINMFLKNFTDLKFGKDFIDLATKISGGNPSIIEQMVFLNNDIKRNGLKNTSYSNIESIIDYRLKILKQEDYNSYRMLTAMSVLGVKFYPAQLEYFDNNPIQEFERIIEKLVHSGFITQLNNLSFEIICTLWSNLSKHIFIIKTF